MKYAGLLAIIVGVASCGSDAIIAIVPSEVDRVEVFPTDTLVFTPNHVQMRAVVYDTAGRVINKAVTWTVVNVEPVAFVDATGLVRPNSQHQYVYIKAAVDGKSGTGKIFWTTAETTHQIVQPKTKVGG